ncbi:hypothetical protein ACFLY9_00495, partial [Patescibacteria group bacterium]
ISGYGNNTSNESYTIIAGGNNNTIYDARWGAILGGYGNVAGQNGVFTQGSVAIGGISNTASGDSAATIGGWSNVAAGTVSFAAGRRAKANADGAFALADFTNADFTVGTANVFGARFNGGYWLTGGNVGIGTTGPGMKLDIGGYGTQVSIGNNPDHLVGIEADVNGTSGIQMYNASAGIDSDFRFSIFNDARNQYLSFVNASDANSNVAFGIPRGQGNFIWNYALGGGTQRPLVIGTFQATDLIFGTNNTQRARITSDGNFGIATTAPDKALEINHATGANLRLTYNDADGSAANYADFSMAADGALTIQTAGTDEDIEIRTGTFDNAIFIDDSASRVGIGTADPGVKFHVKDSIAGAIIRLETEAVDAGAIFQTYGTRTNTNSYISTWSVLNSGDSVASWGAYTDGATDAASLRFATQPTGGGVTERMRITSAGNIGINVTDPESLLEIKDTDAHPILTMTAAHNTDYDPQLQFKTDATDTVKFSMGVDAGDSDKFKIFSGSGIGGTSEFVIDGDGNVGIGTDSPGVNLEVIASDISSNDGLSVVVSSASTGLNTDYTALSLVNTNQTNNNYVKWGFADSVNGSNAGAIAGIITNHASNYGDLAFITRSVGGLEEEMRITSAGNVGIGTTGPISALQIEGYLQIDYSATTPAAADCDEAAETGRMFYEDDVDTLWVCQGVSGWASH